MMADSQRNWAPHSVLPTPRTAREKAATAAWEAKGEKKRTRSVSPGRKTSSQHIDELRRPGFPPSIA